MNFKKITIAIAITAAVVSCTTRPLGQISGLDKNGHPVSLVRHANNGFSYRRLSSGVQIKSGDTVKSIIFYGPKTVRVNSNLGESYWQHPSLVVIDQPDSIAFELEDSEVTLLLCAEELTIEIDKRSGSVSFRDVNGRLHTRESASAPQHIEKVSIANAPSYAVSNTFSLKEDEAEAEGATLWAESAPGGCGAYFSQGRLSPRLHRAGLAVLGRCRGGSGLCQLGGR